MKNFFKVLMLLPCLVFLVNCSKSSDKKSNNNQCYNQGQYGQQYGQTTYNSQNCVTNGNNGGYYQSGGQCYSQQGQVVSPTYCQGGTGGTGGYQQCVGWFYYQNQPVYCSGSNCSGYTLVSANTGQPVNCQ